MAWLALGGAVLALLARDQYDAEMLELHFQRARQFSGVLLELADRRGFACRWFLGVGLWWQLKLDLGQAQRFLDAGVKECPQDPELLLAAGTLEEAWARIAPRTSRADPPFTRSSVPREQTTQEHFRGAERHYRRVLEVQHLEGRHVLKVKLRGRKGSARARSGYCVAPARSEAPARPVKPQA